MLLANFTTVRPEMGRTRTYEDWSKFLGGFRLASQ